MPQPGPQAAMRIKPLLIAAAAIALALPALAQEVAQTAAGARRRAAFRRTAPAPCASAAATGRDTRWRRAARRKRGRRGRRPLNCLRRRRRSNIPAGRGAIRGVVGQLNPAELGLGADPWGAASGAFLSTPDAADGHAARLALGAYRAPRRAARQGARAAQRQSRRLGRRARLAAASHGRSGRGADAGRRGRHRPVHAEDGPGRGAERAREWRSAGAVPDSRTASANTIRISARWCRRCARRLPASRTRRPRRSTMRAAAAASAGSTWRLPRRWSARRGTGRAATIEWEPVDSLTAWRFGLATATGMVPPDRLINCRFAAASRVPGAGTAADRCSSG